MSTSPLIDLRSLDFLLKRVLNFPEVFTWEAFAAHDVELAQQTIDLAHKLAVEKFATHRRTAVSACPTALR